MTEISFSRNLFLLALGRVIQILTVFASFRLLTTTLSTSEVGFFFLLQAILGVFGIIVVYPVGTFVNREIHAWQKAGSIRPHLQYYFIFGWGASAAAALFTYLIGEIGLSAIGTHEPILYSAMAAATMVAGATFANTFIPLLNLLERRTEFVVLTVLTQVLALGASYLVVTWYRPNASYWWIATGLIQVLFGFFAYKQLASADDNRHGQSIDLKTTLQELWKFALPIAIANIAVWGLIQGYRPFVESLAGLDVLAVVGLGLGIAASAAAAFEALVTQLFLPRFYRGTHNPDKDAREVNWNRLWRVCFPSYLSVTCVLFLLAPTFVRLLTADGFPQAARFLSIGAVAELARMSGNILILNAQSERNLAPTKAPYWIGVLIALIGCGIAVKIENMEIVAWSIAAGQTTATLLLARNLVSIKMLHVSSQSLILLFLMPLIIGILVRNLNPVFGITIVGLTTGISTLHYWRQEGRR